MQTSDLALWKVLAIGSATVFASVKLFDYIQYKRTIAGLKQKIAKRRQKRDDDMKMLERRLQATDPRTREVIRSLSFNDLRQALREKKYTCVEVLHAFQEQAIKAHKVTNCVTEWIVEAEDYAKFLDDAAKDSSYKMGALFGIPFSDKESVAVKDYDSTMGYASEIGNANKKNANIISILLEAGAYPFVLTNLPQTILYYSTANPIYGQTLNPLNTNRSPGGSSGGESALLSMRGAVFGIGTDVGGSIRLPAHYCGITSIRPAASRISQGNNKWTPGRPAIVSTSLGPMAPELDAIEAVMQVLTDYNSSQKHDVYVLPKAWTPIEAERKLRIGVFIDNGTFPLDPSTLRAMQIAQKALKSCGHTLVSFTPPNCTEVMGQWTAICRPDHFAYCLEKLRLDIEEPTHWWSYYMCKLPYWLRQLHLFLFGTRQQRLFMRYITHDTNELRKLMAQLQTFRVQMQNEWFASKVDVILCPVAATPAVSHATVIDTHELFTYCQMFNFTDYAGAVVSVTKVTRADVQKCAESYPSAEFEHRRVKAEMSALDAVGLPVGVQLAAPPAHEEMCIYACRELQAALKK